MSSVSSFLTICPDPGAAEGGGQATLVSLTSAPHTAGGQKLKCKMVKADIPDNLFSILRRDRGTGLRVFILRNYFVAR